MTIYTDPDKQHPFPPPKYPCRPWRPGLGPHHGPHLVSPIGVGPRGEQGEPGKSFEFEDFTEEQLETLRSNLKAYVKKEEAVIQTVSSWTYRMPMPFSGFRPTDILFIDIEGLSLIEGVDYTLKDGIINFTTPIQQPQTNVHFIALRTVAIEEEDYDKLKGDPGTTITDYNRLVNRPSINGTVLSGDVSLDELGLSVDYNDLNNRPRINGHVLTGNKTFEQLGLSVSYNTLTNRPKINGHTLTGDQTFAQLGLSVSYNNLSNRPQINGVTLTGNKTFADLGLSVTYASLADKPKINGVTLSGTNDLSDFGLGGISNADIDDMVSDTF